MHLASYLVLALAFGITNMILFRRCAEITPIRLSRGLLLTLFCACIQTAMFLLGILLGDLLRFELPAVEGAFTKTNALIFLGLDLFVMVRMLMPFLRRDPSLPLFDLGNNAACAAMAFATGINLLLVGLGAGFVATLSQGLHKALWPMIIILFLAGYWGVMMGRRKVAIRPRLWMIMASVLSVAVAMIAVITA